MKNTIAIIGLLFLAGIIMFIDLSRSTAGEVADISGTPVPSAVTDGVVQSTPPASQTPVPVQTETPQETPSQTPQETLEPTPDPVLQAGATELFNNYAPGVTNPSIVVYKGKRTLELYDNDKMIARFKIIIGFSPEGNKLKEGDGKTPIGEYYVCVRNPNSQYFRSVGLSYPNISDAQRGLDEGVIDQATYDIIKAAIEKSEQPPWNTAMGGDICIHGDGDKRDETKGCIGLVNTEMQIIWDVAQMGTKVTIYE